MMYFIFAFLFASILGFWLQLSYREKFQGRLTKGMFPLIIFDFDGTICSSFPLFLDQIATFNLKRLSPEEEESLKEMRSQQLLKFLGVSNFRLPFLLRKAKKNVQKRLLDLKPIPGIIDLIAKLKAQNVFLGILTSNSEENVLLYLKRHNMDFFDFIYSGNNLFGKEKHLRKILRKGQLLPKEVIYIGDELRDIEAAEKTAIVKGAVTWGYNSKKLLLQGKADFLCDTIEQLQMEIHQVIGKSY